MTRFTFEWSPKSGHGSGEWHTSYKYWKTRAGAARAAAKWAVNMEAEGCPVDTSVTEIKIGASK